MFVEQSMSLTFDEVVAPFRLAVADVFEVHDVTVSGTSAPTIRLRGRLLVDSLQAFEAVSERFRRLNYTARMRREGEDDVILAIPGTITPTSSRLWLALLLFGLTVLSTLYAGAFMAVPNPQGLTDWLAGWPFAFSLLAILLAHELGHYIVARRVGSPVSFPFFIPMPIGFFGTMGAFIQMKAPPKNRRDLLAIAAAGPLAGLAVAIPVLIIGLRLSEVQPLPVGQPYLLEGNSLLYLLAKLLVFGRLLPSQGMDVMLHPVAMAGWAGLLVTGLNLIPAGQLDGGHIVYVLIGDRVRWLNWAVIVALAVLSIMWQGWLIWAGLIFLFGRFHATPLDEITGLEPPQRLIALFVVVLFVLTFVPVPLTLVQ